MIIIIMIMMAMIMMIMMNRESMFKKSLSAGTVVTSEDTDYTPVASCDYLPSAASSLRSFLPPFPPLGLSHTKYRGASRMRNNPSLGPYSRLMPRAL